MLHDVGKMGIPDSILTKRGPLESSEMDVIRRHPAIGADIIGDHDLQLIQLARTIALGHHERWDGGGQPLGLKADAIPMICRIVAIADVFDALTGKRPCKEPWEADEAMDCLVDPAGKPFDADLVSLFAERLPEVSDILRLSNGAACALRQHRQPAELIAYGSAVSVSLAGDRRS